MKRVFGIALVGLVGWTAAAGASGMCWMNHGVHCICPPPPDCPDCSCPCEHRLHIPGTGKRAHEYVAELSSDCCCDRIRAAHKLGSRLHADFCCNPEILDALIHAALCDPCWEVRKTAAWSIALQRARVDTAVLALYLLSRTDPHYMVRDKARDSLDVLLVCRRECFTNLFNRVDELMKDKEVKKLLAEKENKPGRAGCMVLYNLALSGACGPTAVTYHAEPVPAQLPPAPMPKK